MANDCESVGSIKDDYGIIVPKVTTKYLRSFFGMHFSIQQS